MLKVRYYCYFSRLTGYGRAAHDYLMAMSRHGAVDLEICPLGDVSEVELEPRYRELLPLQERHFGVADVSIFHATPRVLGKFANAVRDARHRVALSTWETHELPQQHAVTMGCYDAVITPSRFCEGIFDEEHGNVHVVPHCFDPDFWHGSEPRTDPFTFYSIGAAGARKNNRGILKAYLHAFEKSDNTNLVIVVPPGTSMDGYHSIIARSGIAQEDLPGITVINQTLSEDQLVDLHRGGACYVSAARGEGWGLGLFEATIMGKPIISPLWGGQSDFLIAHESGRAYGALYDVVCGETPAFGEEESVSVETDAQGRRVMKAHVDLATGINCKQRWSEPDLGNLAYQMETVCNDHSAKPQSGELWRGHLEKTFGYEAVGPQFTRVLEEICS